MGVKNIHLALIIIAFIFSLVFGVWSLTKMGTVWAYASFAAALGLGIYGVQFIKKLKVL